MPRLCERPGCSTPADVAYGFDAEALAVWLDGFDMAQGSRSGVLCRRHADAMVVPLGWMLDDRREPVPRLFTAASMNDLTDGLVRPRARRARSDRTLEMIRTAAMQLSLEDIGGADGVVHELGPVHLAPSIDPTVPAPVPVGPIVGPDAVEPDAVEPDAVEPDAVELDAVELDAVELDAVELDAVEERDAQVLPWQPRFDEQDDLSGLLQARGRLLSRAFRGITADGA